MNRITRKAAALGAAGLLAGAGVVGIIGHNAVHAASPPAVTQQERATEPTGSAATDTDRVQQEIQSGVQENLGGPDAAVPGQAPDTDAIQSQSGADTP